MNISGLQTLTLLDYPGHLACTVFTKGCNYRCPFCHNALLVTETEPAADINQAQFFSFLNKRKKLLEGVCITGGEPTLQNELPQFLYEIKKLGYLVKLDTNGTHSFMLQQLIEDRLVDYVAMDIKNSREKYSVTTGVPQLHLDEIERSAALLLSGSIPYEFRTTVVQEFHTKEDFGNIGRWITGAKQYYLQAFQDSGNLICEGLHPPSKEELLSYQQLLKPFCELVALRGMD